MANDVQILDKIERNARQLDLTVVSRTATELVIDNGDNDLTVSYDLATIQEPIGGVDDSTNPFLGIGIANPGKIRITGADENDSDNESVGSLLDTQVAAQLFHIVAGHANNIILAKPNSGAGAALADTEIRGHADLVGMGA